MNLWFCISDRCSCILIWTKDYFSNDRYIRKIGNHETINNGKLQKLYIHKTRLPWKVELTFLRNSNPGKRVSRVKIKRTHTYMTTLTHSNTTMYMRQFFLTYLHFSSEYWVINVSSKEWTWLLFSLSKIDTK